MSKYHIHMGAAVIFLLLTGAVAGCTKGFDKLAADPARPSDAPVSALMNTIASAMQNDGSEYTFLFNELYTPLSELNGSSKRLGVDAVSRSNAPLWTRYYHMMKNVRDAEQKIRSYKGDTDVYVNVKAVMKIMTAQVTLRTVNFFGDIPFSQAGYAFSGPQQVLQPRYDAQQDIYTQALADLQWASEHLQLESGATTASGEPLQPVSANIDPYFGGNLLSWKAFANGLRLRYALLLSDVAPQQATAIITDIISHQLPLPDGSADAPDIINDPIKLNNTGYDLLGAYRPAGSSGVRLGSTMWQYLSLNNNPDGSGIVDPRTYIWYLKNKDGQWLPYPQDNPSSALPDDADVYLTLDNIANPPSVYSPINLNLLNQNNDIPRPILSVAEVKFLLAEAYLRGIGVAKDPAKSEQYYYDGIRSSINYWFSWVNKSGAWVNKPATPTDAAINTLLAAPMVVFTGDDVTKLRRIYAQEWLSMFWQPDMAFYLMRRTNMTPHSGTPYDASFYRLKYPPAEAAYNKANYNAAVATLGQDDTGKKLWWMK